MRQSVAAEAVICRAQNRQTYWLARWNRNWQCYHLVGGHKKNGESFRQCVIREVAEELGLREQTDFQVDPEPFNQLKYTAWSRGANEETAYTVELFNVDVTEDALRKLHDNGQDVRWLTQAEILAQRCGDGKSISETMGHLLKKSGWPHPVRHNSTESQTKLTGAST